MSSSNTKEDEEERWNKQKLHIDEMINKLKSDLKDVQGLDKDLTRQFILLGSQINKIKYDMNESFDDTSFDEQTEEDDDKQEYDTKL